MRKKLTSRLATLSLVVALAATPALATEEDGFELSSEQLATLDELRTELHADLLLLHLDLFARQSELRELWAAEEIDEAALLAKTGELDEIRRRMRGRLVSHGIATLGVLTPEQRARHSDYLRRGDAPHTTETCPAGKTSVPVGDWL